MSRIPVWRAQFLALAVVWGSSFLWIKVLGKHWPPIYIALGRIALGAAVLLLIVAVRRTPLPRGRVWGLLAVNAVLMNAGPFTLYAYGETKVSSVLAGLWNATTPLITLVVLLTVMRDERPNRRNLATLAAGFAGVAVLIAPWSGLGGNALIGDIECLGAAVCYGLGGPFTRRFLSGRPESGVALAAAQLSLATVMMAIIAPVVAAPSLQIDASTLTAVIVLGVFCSGLAYVLMYAIVRAAGAGTFSTVTYVIPVVSTALGVVVLGEPLTWNEPVGAVIVLAAMMFSSRSAPSAAPSDPAGDVAQAPVSASRTAVRKSAATAPYRMR
jgi:drug/metabolite transporter (DMT)-like permease